MVGRLRAASPYRMQLHHRGAHILMDMGVIDLWALKQKVQTPLYNLSEIDPIILDNEPSESYTFRLPYAQPATL